MNLITMTQNEVAHTTKCGCKKQKISSVSVRYYQKCGLKYEKAFCFISLFFVLQSPPKSHLIFVEILVFFGRFMIVVDRGQFIFSLVGEL